jgi:hypothetical protein
VPKDRREIEAQRSEQTNSHTPVHGPGEGHPTLNTQETAGEKRTLTLAFGYVGDEPTAALFLGDDLDPILLPREFLQLAIEHGWEMQP